MKIVVSPGRHVDSLTTYFDFNQINYEINEFFDPTLDNGIGAFNFTNQLDQKHLIIMNWDILKGVLSDPNSFNDLVKVCQTNFVWIWNDLDGLFEFLIKESIIKRLDDLVPENSIKIFFDGHLKQESDWNLKNIKYGCFPYNFFLSMARIAQSNLSKKNCSKDYLLTMIKKPLRPHRDILYNELKKHDGLIEKGCVKYSSKDTDNYIGSRPPNLNWIDGHPSMDLYLDCWLEVVPETLCKTGLFITEKTVKPIATKTPFLVVSTPGYLEYLKKYGFKTFDSIVDESYDQIDNLNDRIVCVVNLLKDIIQHGSKEFYTESMPILDHNLNRLFEITGKKQFEMDCFIKNQLDMMQKFL